MAEARGRSRGGRAQTNGGRNTYEPYPQYAESGNVMRDRVLEVISGTFPPGYPLEESQRPATAALGLAQVRRGGCMLCLEHGHLAKKCRLKSTPRAREMYDEFCKVRRETSS